jgi:hypothetical protein
MQPPNASWINFLRKYGPLATNDNMYDETIERSRHSAGIEPIELPTPFLDDAIACLSSSPAQSVILTGTAGDGKTYYCRKLWEHFGGDPSDWANDTHASDGMYRLKLDDRELCIIKDLSEINKTIVRTVLAAITKDFVARKAKRVYVIAANHGQLYEQWFGSVRTEASRKVWCAIEDQLVDGRSHSDIPVRLFDLSKRPAAESLRSVIASVVDHPRWRQCSDCELRQSPRMCPIFENRARLREGETGALFRDRLAQLVELKSQNGRHISVRQQLMLVANMLLGHEDGKNALIGCGDVANIQQAGTEWKASIYSNALGENLTPRVRRNRDVFEKLERLGLGQETSNRIDQLLTLGADDPNLLPDYTALIGSDPLYGSTSKWRTAQAGYLEQGGFDVGEDGDSFAHQLRLQRQRLFFSVPSTHTQRYELWQLTVYQNGQVFLDTLKSVTSGRPATTDIIRRLIRGLNRVFTGELVEDCDALIIASSGSYSQSRRNLLYEGEISVRPSRGESVTLVRGVGDNMALRVQVARPELVPPVDLPLTVLRFEFLCRVAEGSLPSSFSLECYEDVLAFKGRVLAALQQRRVQEGDSVEEGQGLVLRFVDLLDDGTVRPHEVEVRTK